MTLGDRLRPSNLCPGADSQDTFERDMQTRQARLAGRYGRYPSNNHLPNGATCVAQAKLGHDFDKALTTSPVLLRIVLH
jgi:hypothetical protein